MDDLVRDILAVLAGYLLGSFPSAYIAARLVKGQDIRDIGEGNMGTLNALRGVGLLPGILVFAADVFKGTGAILVAEQLGAGQVAVFVAGLAAIVGHTWSVFRGFKGGRGGATTYGVLAAFSAAAGGIVFGIMLAVLILTSNGRLSLMAGFVAMPLLMLAFGLGLAVIVYAIILPLVVGLRMASLDWRKLREPETRRNLIVDHNFTWWQKKKK
jgi:glycerol-3-phosphate acyltransferase PlsY